MKRTPVIVAALCALALSLATTALPAQAAPSDDVDKIVRLFPGATREQVESSIAETAASTGKSPAAVSKQILKEADAGRAPVAKTTPGGGATPALSGGGTIALAPSWYKGDIFVSSAGLLWFGHAGIYTSTTVIVHAPGLNQYSLAEWYSSVGVGSGSVGQYVSTSQTARNNAGNFAYNYLRGKPYNTNFWSNKYVSSSAYNCSQLVWAAYRGATGIDLDGNGGTGVYPWDLEKSGLTQTYRRY